MADPSYVLVEQPIELKEDLSYVAEPLAIVDRKEQILRSKVIPLVKVVRRRHSTEEATWESEDIMKMRYPYLFDLDHQGMSISGTKYPNMGIIVTIII